MTSKHRFAEMTWEEVNEAVEQRRVALLPVGAIEQHGRHLPVNVDNLLADHVCESAAAAAPEVMVVLPQIHYGFNDHNMDFPGTISVKMQHFIDFVYDVCHSLAHQGFRRILIVNAHGSNGPLCELAARRVTVETEALCGSINHWMLAWKDIVALLEGGSHAADHACEWETSEYLALRPDLVKRDKIKDEIAAERGGPRWLYPSLDGESPVKLMNFWSCMTESGVNGTPSFATAEKGRRMLSLTVERLVQIAREFRDLPEQARIDQRAAGPRAPGGSAPASGAGEASRS